MSNHDNRTLINQGRKAGLNTAELYAALNARPPQRVEGNGEADTNGFVRTFDEHGQQVYRPALLEHS